ncbi:Retrovirus-related Pol polyprotein from transposon opus [Vitis vinifera]|uniref:Retrovirus-related Pol polyprotein from transposon opus n=1 Tax=Vitis vinifera TaxID=29760 RepID=A0A438D707_VITVI|nr:Retrovirus-related Pol polyprotein from transposon opus [Vitis vinifera]
MEVINACPHHGFDTWLLVSYFYDEMSSSMKQLLETMCGGDFMSYVVEVSREWDEPNKGEVWKTKSQPNAFNAKVGMYTLNEDIDMKAKVAAMTRRLEELELKKIREVQVIAETSVEMFGDQANVIEQFKPNNNASYGNTYNSNWRNHPNFSWKLRAPQYTQPGQTSQQASNLEQAIVNLSKVMLTNLNTVQEKGRFPSQPHQNPKGIHEVEAHEGESSQVRDVKALITLRSSKKVELPTPKPHVEKEEEEEETEKREKIKGKKKDSSERKEDHDSTVNENPEKVKVNIPLLDMIKQVSTYAKFLKDLCTIKRGLNVNKKAFLTEQVSAIIQCKSPLKCKDPGCPTISVMIGGTVVEKALLDLGASVNLLPYSVYKQLGLGELKPTSITLSLADRSVKIPRGIIEDVLVQVDNFYYLVDFVVLDTDPIVKETNYVPIILGRPFLATSNAIINCRNGLMQLTFGNRTLELNIFYMSKKLITPEEKEGPKEVCIINTLVEEHCNQKMQEKLNESLRDLEEGLTEPSDLLATLQGISPLVCTHHIYMEEEVKPICQPQRRLNPHMQEVVQAEVLKLLQAGIVLGHIISKKDIEVDKANVELIIRLPPPTTIKRVRQFLGHAGFYKRSFEQLKQFLTTALIVRALNWQLPFEVMCDASDFAIGVVLGQREDGKPYVIYYASKTLNEARMNYTTIEKELLAVVFALDKFRAYLVGSFTDHLALKYLLTKKDAKARLIRWILLLQEFNLQIKDKKEWRMW